VLGGYAEREPLAVLREPRFYQDVLLQSPRLETTVMVQVNRDVALQPLFKCAPAALRRPCLLRSARGCAQARAVGMFAARW
jgi:hypothetical protein